MDAAAPRGAAVDGGAVSLVASGQPPTPSTGTKEGGGARQRQGRAPLPNTSRSRRVAARSATSTAGAWRASPPRKAATATVTRRVEAAALAAGARGRASRGASPRHVSPHSRIKSTLPPQPHDRRFQPLARIRWPFVRPTEGLQRALFRHWNVHFLSTLTIMAWYQSSPHEQRWT